MPERNLIAERTHQVNKTYSFIDYANPRVISEYWFQNALEGKTLFLVFYTQACRYSKCLGCNLPSKMSQYNIDFKNIMKQIDSVFHNILDDEEKDSIKKIIVSNNGSVLDEDTFSTTALIYLIAKINSECVNVEVVSLETRPEYIEFEELEILARSLQEGQCPSSLEIAIGVEAFDDKIRNDFFTKGLNLDKVDKLVNMISETNKSFLNRFPGEFNKMKLKTYFMLKPVPDFTEEDAIEDIKRGIDFLDALSIKYDVEINMHLNPTYAATGTVLEEEFKKGNFIPPRLESVREAVLYAEKKAITIFIGLNDEGLSLQDGSFIRKNNKEDLKLLKLLEQFNSTQDYTILKNKL